MDGLMPLISGVLPWLGGGAVVLALGLLLRKLLRGGQDKDDADAGLPPVPADVAARREAARANAAREAADDEAVKDVLGQPRTGDAAADLDAALRASARRHGGPAGYPTGGDGKPPA